MGLQTYEIKRELKKWDENVIFNAAFKPDTKANLKRLDEIYKISYEHFICIAANSEALVYKIGRYFIELGTKYESTYFVDTAILKSFIGDDASEWRKKERCDEYFKMFGGEMCNKFVLIPYADFPVSVSLAVYFISMIRSTKALGVILYGEGNDNLSEVLNLNYEDPFLYEFPNKKYKPRKRKIQDDEY